MAVVRLGDSVHYVYPDGQCRPAVVVRVWNENLHFLNGGMVNLQVFTDGTNDSHTITPSPSGSMDGVIWKTSVAYGGHKLGDHTPNTWHYPYED